MTITSIEDTWEHFQGEDGTGYVVNIFKEDDDDEVQVNLYKVPKEKTDIGSWYDHMVEVDQVTTNKNK